MIAQHDAALLTLDAGEIARAIAAGRMAPSEHAQSCLACIAATDEITRAFAFIDREYVLAQAEECEGARRRGVAQGRLAGVCIGVMDTIDTADMPTELGTPLCAGRRPQRDATVVSSLRGEGAILLGKTATSAFAIDPHSVARNPHDSSRSAGGPCGGAAAAIAGAMAPAAVATDNDGSLLTAASYCGIVGYLPTRGWISRTGALRISPILDRIGVLARTVADAALVADALCSFDAADDAMRPQACACLARSANETPVLPPRFVAPTMSASDDRSMAVRAGFAEVVRSAADRVEEASLADATRGAAKAHGTLRDADIALRLSSAGEPPSDALSTPTRRTIERGRKRLAIDYNRALEHRNAIDAALAPAFHVAHALIWASANGEAPHDGAGGNVPAITTVVSLLGLPAVTVPMLRGDRGLPIGVTLVGPRGDDARLLQSALWLVQRAKG